MRFRALLMLATWAVTAETQAPTGSILRLEFENGTFYVSGYRGVSDQLPGDGS
jgi:hypothetical protein